MPAAATDEIEQPRQVRSAERVFLSAEWRDLVMLNYEVEPDLVANYVPCGTELDSFDGKVFLSLVGFRFLRAKLFGFAPLPFHANFDEVNLRFYVKRRGRDDERRGVVFIREIVPRLAVAQIANLAYRENYVTRAMRHDIHSNSSAIRAKYEWRTGRDWCGLYANASGPPVYAAGRSVAQCITEHYWGYSAWRDGGSGEYHVAHVPWRVWRAASAGVEGDCAPLFGEPLGRVLSRAPNSAFIADGSPVEVYWGRRVAL